MVPMAQVSDPEHYDADVRAARKELLIDTFASWALEGMLPTPEDIALAKAYINNEITLEEIIANSIAEFQSPEFQNA